MRYRKVRVDGSKELATATWSAARPFVPLRLNGTSPPNTTLTMPVAVSLAHWLGLKNRNPPRNCRRPSAMKSMQVAGNSPAGYSHTSAGVSCGVLASRSGSVLRLIEHPARNTISMAAAIRAPAAMRARGSRMRPEATPKRRLRLACRREHTSGASFKTGTKRLFPTWTHASGPKKDESAPSFV